jgi:hypothetical protein
LTPQRVRAFKFSRDKRFIKKRIGVVGLYLRPPEHALVLSVDEKRQIQASDRTQPGLPLSLNPEHRWFPRPQTAAYLLPPS